MFQTVQRPWQFTVSERFMTLLSFYGHKKVSNDRKRTWSGTENDCNAERQERLETFESERRNVLERIVENVHRTVTFTCYNYCKYNTIIYKINYVPNHQRFKKFT